MAAFWISLPGAGAAPVARGIARREQCVHPGDPAAMKRMMKVLRGNCERAQAPSSPCPLWDSWGPLRYDLARLALRAAAVLALGSPEWAQSPGVVFPVPHTAQHGLVVLGEAAKILIPPWCEALQPAKPFLSFLPALCPCVGSQSSPARPEKGGRATGTVPVDFMTFVDVRTSLLERLQDHEGDRVETYRELEIVLHGNNSFLTSGAVNRLIAEASRDMRAAQGVTCEVKMVASNVLVTLARSHFHFVMAELQSHLKAMGKVPDEIVLLTLGKMAHSYALRCIPFVRMTMLALHAMLSRVGSGRILRAICSVLEQWSKAVNTHFCKREQCPFPGKGVAQFCEAIYPVFRYVVVNWLECTEEADKQAVLGAVAAMMGVLLREEQHREHAWEQLPWLLHQYHWVLDTSWVSKSLCYVLEVLEGVQTPIPQGTALAIRTAVHRQLSDVTPEPGPAHQAVLTRCMVLQARMCPEKTAVTLHSLLSGGSEAGRMAALGLLGAQAHSDGVVPVRVSLHPTSPEQEPRKTKGQKAGALLCCAPCWAQRPGSPARSALWLGSPGSPQASAVTPQLLSALSPGWGHQRCEGDGTAGARHLTQPFFLPAAQLPAPQVLLSRLLVVAAAPYAKRERAVAALQLLQTLQGRIHRALGAAWVTEIPLLLQYLQGRTESTLHSAEWQHRVLQFLRASLEPIEDQTWTVGLSQELSQQLGSSAPRSWEKLFLYKALGTALAACRDLRHVQGQVLRFLQETNPVELSEAQGMVSVVSYAAESHFHLVLDTVTMFSAAFTRDGFYQTSTGWEASCRSYWRPVFLRGRPGIGAPEVSLEGTGFDSGWIRATQPGQMQRMLACSCLARDLTSAGAGAVGKPFWAGQGPAERVVQHGLGGEQPGLICASDRHRLRISEQDRDRLCQIPFHRKVPDSSPTSPISGKTASSVCGAGCTSSPSPCENPSCGVGAACSPPQSSQLEEWLGELLGGAQGKKELVRVQRGQNTESAQATCAALMRTYSGIALRAPKEQLLTRVDREILGNILQLSRAKQRDLVLKMALVESITEVSCAIQAVGVCGSFELSLKQEAMQTLLDWIKGEPWDSLVYGVFHVLEELSKLRPPLSREENRKLLSVCCQSALSYPSKEQMEKRRRTGKAAVNVQILNRRNMEDLSHLMETWLETEATSACFDDVVLVLKGWLTSAEEWERERALWVCAHVLGACKERCELLVSRGPHVPCVPFPPFLSLEGSPAQLGAGFRGS
ncbi:maestro heat-like repeat-containing protein family member 2B [Strix aluco]|uniref:maestro heat-like repeat-containing protein family member 2B n=1 Tax=Strix aluco TaxID=111821 RepID=UPI003DA3B039